MSTRIPTFLIVAFAMSHLGGAECVIAQTASPQAANEKNPTTSANETLEESLAKMPSWTVLAEASAYRVGASGKVRMPGSNALSSPLGQSSLKLEKIGADNPQWGPYGRVRWRPTQGSWSFGASGFGTSIDELGVADETSRVGDMLLFSGDIIHTEIQFHNIDVEAAYRVFERARGKQSGTGSTKVAPYVDLTMGLRVIDTDVRFSHTTAQLPPFSPGQRFEADNHDVFFQPIVGARAGIELVETFNIDLRFNFGGLPGTQRSITWDIEPCFTWRPWSNVGVHVGYRNLFLSVRSGGDNERYSWRGGLAGLYFGVTGRF